ncbi:MAG: zinc ribbon domain-containing protein [bacterium]
MPIYEYECSRCGVFEVMQGISEEPLKTCPHCKRCKVKKLISESTFHLKGSGWYATDYARKGAAGDNGGNGKHEKKQDSKSASEAAPSETKTDTKTESAADSKADSKNTQSAQTDSK